MRTEFSSTLFSGDAAEWVRYLSRSAQARHEPDLTGRVVIGASGAAVVEPVNSDSVWFCSMLTEGLGRLRELAAFKPHVVAQLDELLRQVGTNSELHVVLSRLVPALATREVVRSEHGAVRIVLNRGLMLALKEALNGGDLTKDEGLGVMWPVIGQLVSHLAFPEEPRNRYSAKIDVAARWAYVAVNVLYAGEEAGELVCSPCGETFERVLAATSGYDRKEIRKRDGYLRLLQNVGFVRRARPFAAYARELRIAAREYLDSRYMRLSLSGAMPDPEVWREPMVIDVTKKKPRPGDPRIGRFGVANEQDLDAWSCVSKPLRELGFVLLGQLGMGEFGRVYEAYNLASPDYPLRVALKVDKIVGRKKKAILEAEAAMQVGRDLAGAPHLVRMYDTGKIQGRRFTYHVLQLIEGETLDGLVGSTEVSHRSLSGPPTRRSTLAELRRDLAQRIGFGDTRAHIDTSVSASFRFGLSPAMLMDLLTDMLMCLEEVHELGYAMNDLKNDNLMVSRRGQVKGIDLDSFSRIDSPLDKYTDFLFLATSLVLVTLHASAPQTRSASNNWRDLLQDESKLRHALGAAWPASVIELVSEGRVSQAEIVDILVRLISRSKDLTYAAESATFSHDISELVRVKQRLLLEDQVID